MSAAHDDRLIMPLAPTLAALPDNPRRTIDRLHEMRFRFVQLSATQMGMRPRDLDQSARRDLLATLRRREMAPAGVDLWIPPEHFADAAHVDRAVAAALSAIVFAADLGRVPLSLTFPTAPEAGAPSNEEPTMSAAIVGEQGETAIKSVIASSQHHGVPLADHAAPMNARETHDLLGVGIDPAAWLAACRDPAQAITTAPANVVAARLADISQAGSRQAPGLPGGRLDVLAYRAALSAIGYRSPVVLDARQWTDPWRGVGIAVETWGAL